MTRGARQEDAYLVTTAPENPRDELRTRQRRYLITMGIRVFCFFLAILLYVLIPAHTGPLRVVIALLAVVLPWVAVVMANAGPSRRPGSPSLYRPAPRRALDQGTGGPGSDREQPGG